MDMKAPVNILVLGPMGAAPTTSTTSLLRFMKELTDDLSKDPTLRGREFAIASPDSRLDNSMVNAILSMIERADLCVIDLTGEHVAVSYETGLVHALGLPYIFISNDDRNHFYFQKHEITRLDPAQRYDPAQPAHKRLRQRIYEYATNEQAPAMLSQNDITAYYKQPIIEISGASGFAAGYYKNSLDRFLRSGGFFDESTCLISYQESHAHGSPPNEPTKLTERGVKIDHFIAVRPPHLMCKPPEADNTELLKTLELLGLGLQSVTINRLKTEPDGTRGYFARFLVRLVPQSEPTIVEPAVVIEIPSTVYAFPMVPQVRVHTRAVRPVELQQALTRLRRRKLEAMLDRFEVTLLDQFATEKANPENYDKFTFTPLSELPATLRKLSILP